MSQFGNFRNRSVNQHRFSMVPRADVPRASFQRQHAYKTTFNTGLLIPVFCDEVLPGDTFNVKMTAFARMSTPLFPIIDNLKLSSFFFFVPNRLVWENWTKFMGERDNPDDSIDYITPMVSAPADGYASGSIFDYFGLPVADPNKPGLGANLTPQALPFRAYNLIYNEWFRDENLQDSVVVHKGDAPDFHGDYKLLRRGKRHDYFTSALPWPQKGDSVSIPLTGDVQIYGDGSPALFVDQSANPTYIKSSGISPGMAVQTTGVTDASTPFGFAAVPQGLFADLSSASAATINQLRQAFQIQALLERDARGGTRYTEILQSHFGVRSPDARLQRPEYLGGSTVPVVINPVANTVGISTPGERPLGSLGGVGHLLASNHGFQQSFVEHGFVIGLVCVDSDLTYQQGLHKMWSRRTRYDYYFPAFANLGEQAILSQEIYFDGSEPLDTGNQSVFGYQERWAEYRYKPSQITGLLRSGLQTSLDVWHLSQYFEQRPLLNDVFIQSNPPLDRVLAVVDDDSHQFIFDAVFENYTARPMPLYSVPYQMMRF